MNFDEYQTRAHETAEYPIETGTTYTVLGLASEAGEVAGLLSKWIRGDIIAGPDSLKMLSIFSKELGDTLWFLAEICTAYGLSLEDVAQQNLEKLSDRSERGVIKGSGDKR